MKNYYKVLGVAQSAAECEIFQAYNTLADKYNPQKNKGDKYAEERFIDISVAYKTLINKEKRDDYDIILNSILSASERTDIDYVSIPVETPESAAPIYQTQRSGLYFSVTIFAIAMAIITTLVTKKSDIESIQASSETAADLAKPISVKPTGVRVAAHPVTVPVLDKNNKIPAKKTVTLLNTQPTTNTPVPVDQEITKEITASSIVPVPTTQYSIGSPKQEVLNIQGTPNAIVRYNNANETWRYEDSKIEFVNGRVASFENKSNNLFVQSN